MKCQNICSNISSNLKYLFSSPSIFQAQCGRPAKICYEEIIRKSTAYGVIGGMASIIFCAIPCFKSQNECRNAFSLFPVFASAVGLLGLMATEFQISKACNGMYESNAREFLYSSKPSQKLVDEVLKSYSSMEKLLVLAKFNGSLQKEKMIPLIALYADRNVINKDQFIRLLNAAPWTKEDKFICLKVLLERSKINALNLAIEKGFFQADDLSLVQKQELWSAHTEATKPLLERLGCSPN